MNKKIFTGVVVGLSVMASSCFAAVFDRVEQYKGNELKIPQVTGIDAKAAKKINDYIMKNVAVDAKKFIDKHGKDGNTAWLNTEIVRDDEKYLSLRIASATYFKGAVHPNAYMFGLVFDKQTGKKLPLSYFVTMPSVSVFEDYVRRDIFKMYTSADYEIKLANDMHITRISEEYTLDENDNLDLIYQQYELGPYAWGSPRIMLDKLFVDRNGNVLPKG